MLQKYEYAFLNLELLESINYEARDIDENTPAHYLCRNFMITTEILDILDMNAKNVYGLTPMHYLCQNPAITREMLEYGDMNVRDVRGRTPLYYLCGLIGLKTELLYTGDFNIPSDDGITPMILLVRSTKFENWMWKFDGEIYDSAGLLPIHHLCRRNYVRKAWLIGKDLSVKTRDGKTAFSFLCKGALKSSLFQFGDLISNYKRIRKYNRRLLWEVLYSLEIPYGMNFEGRHYKHFCENYIMNKTNFKYVSKKMKARMIVLLLCTPIIPQLLIRILELSC